MLLYSDKDENWTLIGMHTQFKRTLTQLGGIIRYEFIRNWRRKGLPMMMSIWLVSVVWGTNLFVGPTFFQPAPELIAGSPLINKVGVTLDILIAGGGISTVFVIFTLSILAAEVVPVDRHLGVMEWFNALSMQSGTYLLGKLLGMWTAVFIGMSIVALVSGIAHYIWLGVYDLWAFVQLWLFALTGIALYISGITLFITSWIKSRRWAIFITLGLSIAGYIYLMPGFLQFIAKIYTAFYQNNLEAIGAETCRILPDMCGQPLMVPELFPTLVEDMRLWTFRLVLIFLGTALLAWGIRKWEEQT